MIILLSFKKITISVSIIILVCLLSFSIYYKYYNSQNSIIYVDDFQHDMLTMKIQEIFNIRNRSILDKSSSNIKNLYNHDQRNGRWAYEHALKKMKYLHSWSAKQGIIFKNIASLVIVRYAKKKGDGFSVNLLVSTEYFYSYEDSLQKINSFRIGTYHSLDLMPTPSLLNKDSTFPSESVPTDHNLQITREWYTDPFADSLHLGELENQDIKNLILSGEARDLSNINDRRKNAVNYAKKYCGAASLPEYNYKYNPEYKNYNHLGGDCANFASQILYEGGNFAKSSSWNYYRGAGSRAWVNANSFNNYMIYSGRATVIDRGSYEKVLSSSYKLLPGDYIAYEKKGKVVHISVVTGSDSKGYLLVNSHNTDRDKVPWDLGWSNNEVKFRLVQVHY